MVRDRLPPDEFAALLPKPMRGQELLDTIAGSGAGWVQIELVSPAPVARVVLSRYGDYQNRMPAKIKVEISADGKGWQPIALVQTREPALLKSSALSALKLSC
jgi:hypothetical protein